ncbi:hypothetical protein EGT07_22055 [Herbaspirillum sp. HC18]|nr:hypothetical protein EGT07_22055 [Herbaspirillum sp. HC18]
MMKVYALLAATVLLNACAGYDSGQASGSSTTAGSSASGSGAKAANADIREQVDRGSTHGYDPLVPTRK